MDIQLIQGEFSAKDSLNIVGEMIRVKIRFHENAITHHSSEEDIKYRESKVKYLQEQMHELKNQLLQRGQKLSLHATITME
jgi:hypothetical protein